jgi:hypothetical protein
MKTIPLTQEKVAIVDDEDYEKLAVHKWYAHVGNNHKNKNKRIYYAARCKKGKTILMHREIMSCPEGMEVDHINGNTLYNRKSNLRICTSADNTYNSRSRIATSSYKGVCLHKLTKKWYSQISYKHKKHYIGLFKNEVLAAKAYDDSAKELFGEYARCNFPYRIRRRNIYRWLMATNGRVFSVTFIKRSAGKEKTIRARVGVKTGLNGSGMRYNTRNKKLIVVFDMKTRMYKSIPIDGIEAVACRGRRYRVD